MRGEFPDRPAHRIPDQMTKSTIQQRQTNFDAAAALIRAVLTGEPDLAALRAKCARVDFKELRRVLHVHGMLRLCTPLISELHVFSTEQVEQLRQRGRQTTRARLQILALGRRLSGLFDQAGIRHVHLKGFSLSQRLFSDPAERSYTDVDLLVHINDVVAVDRILKKTGCTPFNDLDQMTGRQRRLFCRLRHDIVYWDPSGRTKIEVHWRFNRARPLSENDYGDLFGRQCAVPIGGWNVPSLSLEDEAGYLIDHGVKHGWLRLKWLYDIYVLSERHRPSVLGNISGVPGLSAKMREVHIAIALSRHVFTGVAVSELTDDAEIAAEVSRFNQMIAEQDLDMPLGEDPRVAIQLLHRISLRDKLHRTLPALLNITDWGVRRPPLGWWPLFVLTGPVSWLRRKGMFGRTTD